MKHQLTSVIYWSNLHAGFSPVSMLERGELRIEDFKGVAWGLSNILGRTLPVINVAATCLFEVELS